MLDDLIGDSASVSLESDIIGDSFVVWLEVDVIRQLLSVTVVSRRKMDGDAIEHPDLWSSMEFYQGCLIKSDRQPWA